MRWFRLDSATPNHPVSRRVMKELGTEGFGAMILLWCYTAQYGRDLPGRCVDSDGDPIPKDILVDVSTLTDEGFDRLIEILYACKSIDQDAWDVRQELFLKGMRSRGDAYAKKMERIKKPERDYPAEVVPLKATRVAIKASPPNPDREGGKQTATRLADTWNKEMHACDCKGVQKVTDKRVALCNRAVKTHGIAALEHAMTMIPTVHFLTGAKGWSATFDWLMKGDNCVKGNEGQYEGQATGVATESMFATNRKELDAFVKDGLSMDPLLLGDE